MNNKKNRLLVHPRVLISRKIETGNIFVVGTPGAGKTIFIFGLAIQIVERKTARLFIYDEKREYTSKFYNPQTTILVAPWDKRTSRWDIQKDAKNEYQAELIADKLIKNTEDPIWSNGSRLIFVGIIVYLNKTHKIWGWNHLASALTLKEEDLQRIFRDHYPRAEKLIISGSKTTQSFFIQLISSLGWIFTLAEAWPESLENSFSIQNWSANNGPLKTIIIQADKRYKSLSAPLANALISLISAQLLAEPNSSERETWLFLDELANMPKNSCIFDWISLGRSKGCRLVAGTQSISQLQYIYSEKETNTFLGMMNTFVALRSGSDPEGSKYVATIFGDREIERQHVSYDKNGNKTISWERQTQPMVSATDLAQLPLANKNGAEGFLKIAGYNAIYKLKWPIPDLADISAESCPAPWLTSNSQRLCKTKNKTNRLAIRRSENVNNK